MNVLSSRFLDLQDRINRASQRSGRPVGSVRLIGVSKKQDSAKILQASQAGLRDFGENYVQEWQFKKEQIATASPKTAQELRWHFIGHLQSNKAKDVVGEVLFIHTVDSFKLAKKISRLAGEKKMIQKILFEVNLAGEPSKYGYTGEKLLKDLASLAELRNLSLDGLMTIPPASADAPSTRTYFSRLKSLLDECNQSGVLKSPMRELSMGMSHDFELAIEEGATMVRIGTFLFGRRL